MNWLYRAVLGFLAVKLAGVVVNLRAFPVLAAPVLATGAAGGAGDGSGRVSLLVPVRDEAHRLAGTLAGLLGQGADEVIFLDDGSGDGSTDLLARAVDGAAAASVVSGSPPGPGWTGKTWACQQLGRAATGDLLVFCDADVVLAGGALAALTAEMARQGADVFSVFPRQRTGSAAEHLLVPLIDDVLLCFLPFPLLSAPAPSAATANGSVLAFRRDAFDALDGFTAVRGEVVEDLAMARLVRRSGLKLGLALGGPLVGTRMYDSWDGVRTGFSRGLVSVAGGRRRLVLVWAWHAIVYTAPLLLVPARRRWAVPLALAVLERLLVEAKTGRRQWAQAALMPAAPAAALPIVLRALRPTRTWKGRSYS